MKQHQGIRHGCPTREYDPVSRWDSLQRYHNASQEYFPYFQIYGLLLYGKFHIFL